MQIQFLVLELFHNGRRNKYIYVRNFCSACKKTFLALLLRGTQRFLVMAMRVGRIVLNEKKIDNDRLDQSFMKEVYFGPKFGWVLILSRDGLCLLGDRCFKLKFCLWYRKKLEIIH